MHHFTVDNLRACFDSLDGKKAVGVDGVTKATYEGIRIGANFDKVIANVQRLLRLKQTLTCPLLQKDFDMLDLRPNCENCNCDLPPASTEAMICSFECTFCEPCARTRFGGRCPNCGGNLVARPIRPAAALAQFPASTQRVVKPHGDD